MSDALPVEITQHHPLPLSQLPDGWERVWLADIASNVSPGFASGKHSSNGKGVPHLRPMNINRDGQVNLAVVKSVASTEGIELAAGDVLFNNTNSPELVGKTALISEREAGFAYSNHMTRVRLAPGVEPAFVARQLHFLWISGYLKTRCTNHVNQASISSTTLASTIPLLLAPVAEQTRIVERLEEALFDLDDGVKELKSAQKKLAKFRQSVLRAAVKGELSAEWRTKRGQGGEAAESAAQLLERILQTRRAHWEASQLEKFKRQDKPPPKGWQAKYQEPSTATASGSHDLPKGWQWATLGQCFRVAVGATPSRKEPSYWNGNIPWVSSGEVRFSRITATKERITELGLMNSSTEINPAGSVMLGMIGEGKTRGQVAILNIDAANNQNCAAILVSETEVPPEYVYYWLWSRYEETRRGSSGNNQPALNKSIVERIPIPLAPLDEMRKIVRLVEESLSQIDSQQAAVSEALRRAAAQHGNLLATAFSGRLVPQDPSDESAAELLRRIKAERSKQEVPLKPRGSKVAKGPSTMVSKLIDVLAEAADWMPAQEAFRRCGIADGAATDEVEALYAELRALDKSNRLSVEAVTDTQGRKLYDRLRLLPAD